MQRGQRHRGRTDEARKETARAADRKRLGRQNEVDVRRSRSQRLTSIGVGSGGAGGPPQVCKQGSSAPPKVSSAVIKIYSSLST